MRMDDDSKKRVEEIPSSEVVKRVKKLQASMPESAKSCFDELELGHRRWDPGNAEGEKAEAWRSLRRTRSGSEPPLLA